MGVRHFGLMGFENLQVIETRAGQVQPYVQTHTPVGLRIRLKLDPIRLKSTPHKAKVLMGCAFVITLSLEILPGPIVWTMQ
ncbi:hypothetical protein EDE15_3559 [Edaphobacter aggregans]|uniref:Uncharacterized protein n=1 Tax=Edaphobacter aggregans TaxID=570835 RepID=A0A428MM82_9BACT|nr:hypothetical protein EDE15_3559 [Edaphobacter aggregans]